MCEVPQNWTRCGSLLVNASSKHGCGPKNCTQVCPSGLVGLLSVWVQLWHRLLVREQSVHLLDRKFMSAFQKNRKRPDNIWAENKLLMDKSHTLSTEGKCENGKAVNKPLKQTSQLQGAWGTIELWDSNKQESNKWNQSSARLIELWIRNRSLLSALYLSICI